MPPLEGDAEEVKEGKGLKILPPNKLSTILPILLPQTKVENNSYKLKNEIRQILYLQILLYQYSKITKRVYNNLIMEENMIMIRDPKIFWFNFDWPKEVDENFKHEIEFIIKSNESSAESKTKNEIEQLLLKYKHGNDIHEHRKQQSERTS